MKIRLSLIFITLSVFFLSCSNGISQKGEGSITLDAGRVARYLGQNLSKNRSVSRTIRHTSGSDFDNFMVYKMSIKVSTLGNFETSVQKDFSKSIVNADSEEEYCATLQSFFDTSVGTPISIENIPVGSKIKIKVALTFGEEIDEDAFREVYSQMSEEEYTRMMEDMHESLGLFSETVEGYSNEFTVKSGSNTVTIRLDGREFFVEQFLSPDSNHPIILFNGRDAENVLKYQKNTQSKLVIDTPKSVSFTTGASLFSSISGGESITSPMFTSNTFCFADDCIYYFENEEIYKLAKTEGILQGLGLSNLIHAKFPGDFEGNNAGSIIQIDCLTYYNNSLYFPLQIKREYTVHGNYFVKLNLSTNEISYYSNQNFYASNWSSLIVTSIGGNDYLIKLYDFVLTKYRISESDGTITLNEEEKETCYLAYQASDLQLFGNTLYIACYKYQNNNDSPNNFLNSEKTIYNIVSAGGIAKIDLSSGFSLSTWTNGSNYLGMYLGNTYNNNGELLESSPITPPEDQENQYFYGARKFIARRPDDNILVVADDGVYIDLDAPLTKDPNTCENKNRVVTVNLLDESISAVDVNVSFYATAVTGTYFGIGD